MKLKIVVLIALPFFLFSCNDDDTDETATGTITPVTTPVINYTVAATYPHDTTAFTEGLIVHNGKIYESTGSPDDMPQTRSLFGTLDLVTGKIQKKVEIDRTLFGEGICFLKGNVYQLTYRSGKGFIYDENTFLKKSEFKIPVAEGWGLTTDSIYLIMSDGTDVLTYLDPATMKVVKQLRVRSDNGPVSRLNELEYIGHFIFANVYGTSTVIRIDPTNGQVTGRIELGALVNEVSGRYRGSMEMNGIAYDPAERKLYVTGKMWPITYELRVHP